jgi:broad specificity phosphatase PhoE
MHKFILYITLLSIFQCGSVQYPKIQSIIDKSIQTTEGKNNPIQGLGNEHTTVFFIVRHAEKNLEEKDNPNLTEDGKRRANLLAQLMKNANVQRVGHTNTKRSVQTAQPLISALNCGYDVYSSSSIEAYLLNTIDACKGKSVLVVAHSNTVPTILNYLVGSEKYQDIPDEEYDNLYVVTVIKNGNASVEQYKF